jgi:hypothetical protein
MTNRGEGAATSDAVRRMRKEVLDAFELAQYAVQCGIKDSAGRPLPFDDIAKIQTTAAMVGILDIAGSAAQPSGVSEQEWRDFERAYYRLAMALSPVTAETLSSTRATAWPDRAEGGEWWHRFDWLLGYSAAQRFARGLLVVTLCFAAAILALESGINALGMRADASAVKLWRDLLQSVLPWCYGGLGACAFLLRSAHAYIYGRSFDLRRKPEYTNRILLGAVSGGAVILFSDYLVSQEDTAVHVGSAALGFIAGYSTDFLFNTVERVVGALFPKSERPKDQTPNPSPPGEDKVETEPPGSGAADAR